MLTVRTMNKFVTPVLLILHTMADPAWAIDGISIGRGINDNTRIDITRLSIAWDPHLQWSSEGDWCVVRYWQLDLGYWESSPDLRNSGSLVEFAITPVFRFINKAQAGLQPWLEGAIGAHLISETMIADRDLSSTFQFGSHIGAGIRFGDNKQYELGYRFQHLSNAGIKGKNDGVNMYLVRVGYHF